MGLGAVLEVDGQPRGTSEAEEEQIEGNGSDDDDSQCQVDIDMPQVDQGKGGEHKQPACDDIGDKHGAEIETRLGVEIQPAAGTSVVHLKGGL